MTKYIGVDGCKAGWIAVTERDADFEFGVFDTMSRLLNGYPQAELVLVDIPIGLPWKQCPSIPCDTAARKELRSPRASSVFPAPSRAAARADSLAMAQQHNQTEVGRKLSQQAWGICKKIAEVDHLLIGDAGARSKVREVHPEICFWALNDQVAMLQPKKTPAGTAERVAVLRRYEPRTADVLAAASKKYPRKDVQADDILDALVAYVTARVGLDSLKRLQGPGPTHDEEGLPMEMLHL